MSDYLIKGETLTDIANAIREKTGSTSPIRTQDFATEIEGIQTGGGEDIKYLVKVIDYDGTVLKSDNLSEGATFTLPENPTNDGLIFQEWSSPVDIVDGAITVPNSDVTIGAVYETASGMTEIDISFPHTATYKSMSFSSLTGMTSIDWGDGTINTSTSHTYDSKAGDYTIKLAGVTAFNSSFSNSDYIKSIRYAKGVTKIYPSSLNCMTTMTIPNTVTTMTGSLSARALSCLIIPSSCTRFPSLSSCYLLSNVVIPKGITTMYSLQYCYGLTSVTIPDSVTLLENNAFQYCYGLRNITIPNSVTRFFSYVFQYCYGLTSVTIPNSVTHLGNGAFAYCYGLRNITIPDSVTSISTNVFQHCDSLTSVNIPNSVTKINDNTFSNCRSLTSITIPNSVTSIGSSAFSDCYSLTSITIPNSVTSIGSSAFSSCNNMREYDFTEHTSVPTLANSNALGMNANCIIKVPFALYDEWITATNWTSRKNYIRPWVETVEELSNIDGTVYNYVCVGNVEYYYNGTNWEVSRQL